MPSRLNFRVSDTMPCSRPSRRDRSLHFVLCLFGEVPQPGRAQPLRIRCIRARCPRRQHQPLDEGPGLLLTCAPQGIPVEHTAVLRAAETDGRGESAAGDSFGVSAHDCLACRGATIFYFPGRCLLPWCLSVRRPGLRSRRPSKRKRPPSSWACANCRRNVPGLWCPRRRDPREPARLSGRGDGWSPELRPLPSPHSHVRLDLPAAALARLRRTRSSKRTCFRGCVAGGTPAVRFPWTS